MLERSGEDWEDLRARLLPGRFDLAIDLRKHPETRPVLRYTGARYLAGYDHRNQFSWLDVALEWGGDHAFARKRNHAVDDLVNLADAVIAACATDRQLITAPPRPSATVAALDLKKSDGRPLICVHPTTGQVMKQWPVEYFAAVIDQLVEEDRARIVLIGGPGDESVAALILGHLRQPDAVTSLVGKLPLAELPALLAEVSLFIGNDSGPKHIAAGLGVPTVGIHSGTTDTREYGPVGPLAIAVIRDVVCTPCYLSQPGDCARKLACLNQLTPDKVYAACKRLLLSVPFKGRDVSHEEEHPAPASRRAPRRVRRKRTALQEADG
jgi:ADP-heptose:LPS heptosyltransferase